MRIKLSPKNPHGYTRYGYAWEQIKVPSRAHLDAGCNDGFFLASLGEKKIGYRAGVDVARDAINEGRIKYPYLNLQHLENTTPLPFEDGVFESASLLDVLEHVYEQEALLKELYRVLGPDGKLIVTVPRFHIFSFLDRGNIQFYWPGLHKWYYLRTHTLREYEYHYVNNPDNLIGCVSAKKRWHEHFTRRHLKACLQKAGFIIEDVDGTGLFSRLLDTIDFLLGRPAWLKNFFTKLKTFDARHFESCDLFCTAKKPGG